MRVSTKSFLFFLTLGLIVLVFQDAFAQVSGDRDPDPNATIAKILEPYVTMVVSAAVFALLTYVTALIKKWTGIKIEAAQRDALHSALMTGVASELASRGVKAGAVLLEQKGGVIQSAVEYAEKSVPDAIKNLAPSRQVMSDIAASKITLLAEKATGVRVSGEPERA